VKRVLVTGGSGFIGRQALPILAAQDFEVHAVTRGVAPQEEQGVRWHRADLLDPAGRDALLDRIGPTHLLHLAWYAVPGQFWSAEENTVWATASEDLFSAFQQRGGQRLAGVGTCAEYQWGPAPLVESSTPLTPATEYGRCKLRAFRSAMRLAAGSGVASVWARVFHLYGPHEHPDRLVPALIRALARGERFRCTSGDQLRDFLHVRDVADAIVAVLASDIQGAVNVGSGSPVRLRELIETTAGLVGRPDLVDYGALPPREGEPAELYPDVAILRDEVHWSPNIPLRKGLQETIGWWANADSSHAAGVPR
jgi:nucleoside-diphosphate-sugar epimerase